MTAPAVVFDEVSKFYGEVLGVNRVTLQIPPGITSLVGPNGSGKTTLMNLMTGLIHPDHGTISLRGLSPRDPEHLMRITGYATQYDSAPRWATGLSFITTGLLLFGYSRAEAEEKGLGVVALGTKMIDAPVVKHARKVISQAISMGRLETDWQDKV